MQIHNVTQGSPEWLALRSSYFTASEAPAMMGASKYQSRTDLLAQKKTGIAPEVSAAQQKLFDLGHETEALARAIIEAQLGDEDLFPVVATEGNLLASVDGMDMLGGVLFEHKLWNESLAARVRAGELDPHYFWQLEQQLLVTGAERVIFVCSDGTEQNLVQMEYRSVPERREQLLAGWRQFEADLAAYEPAPATAHVVGSAPESLPALRIEVTGMVTTSNLDAFKANALDVFGGINTDLQTDQHFADADKTVKWCGEVEDRLAAAKQHALSQTESIDALFRAIDEISAAARTKRLELSKLVEARKKSIREDIVIEAAKALQTHVDELNASFGSKARLPRIAADFAGAIKGKKTIASLRDAAATELARAKSEASRVAEGIKVNITSLRELAANHAFLFADFQDLVLKANDDLVALIKVRINEHEQAETEKRRVAEENAKAVQVAPAPQPEPVPQVQQQATPGAQAPAEATADDGQRIRLGDINGRLGFSLTADFLRSIGFEAVGRERAAALYRAADFPAICSALITHIQQAQQSRIAA